MKTMQFNSIVDFKQYVPYSINKELLYSMMVGVIIHEDETKRERVSGGYVLSEIFDSNCVFCLTMGQYPIHFEKKSLYLDIVQKIDTPYPNGEDFCNSMMLFKFLEIVKAVGSIDAALNCVWYYYPDDSYMLDHPAGGDFYNFFICYGEKIIFPCVKIINSIYPENMLIKDDKEYYYHENEEKMAVAKVFFKKWIEETIHGKVFSEKNKAKEKCTTDLLVATVSEIKDAIATIRIVLIVALAIFFVSWFKH